MVLRQPTDSLDQPGPETHGSYLRSIAATPAFQMYRYATNRLDALSAVDQVHVSHLSEVEEIRDILAEAEIAGRQDPNVNASLPFRIASTNALAPIRTISRHLFKAREDEQTLETYRRLYFDDAYIKVCEVAMQVLADYSATARNGNDLAHRDISGYAQEITFLLLPLRDRDPRKFATPSSAQQDYYELRIRFDAIYYDITRYSDYKRAVQIKTTNDRHTGATKGPHYRTVYAEQDMSNMTNSDYWADTIYAHQPFPTLTALLDEQMGDTRHSVKLDQISSRLNEKLFRKNTIRPVIQK